MAARCCACGATRLQKPRRHSFAQACHSDGTKLGQAYKWLVPQWSLWLALAHAPVRVIFAGLPRARLLQSSGLQQRAERCRCSADDQRVEADTRQQQADQGLALKRAYTLDSPNTTNHQLAAKAVRRQHLGRAEGGGLPGGGRRQVVAPLLHAGRARRLAADLREIGWGQVHRIRVGPEVAPRLYG